MRVVVMYFGRVMEVADRDTIYSEPLHPYTNGLIGSVPSRNKRGVPLAQIPGMTPSLARMPTGCAFRPRCARSSDACAVAPEATDFGDGRKARCFHPLINLETAA